MNNDKPPDWRDCLGGVVVFGMVVFVVVLGTLRSCREVDELSLLREEHEALIHKIKSHSR